MFTGIIEEVGKVVSVQEEGTNRHITVEADMADELKVDQSLAHDGVCLTVVDVQHGRYTVTAIQETLERSSLNGFGAGSLINLERCMQLGGRLDGHIVQGHVDATGKCEAIRSEAGSWYFTFSYSTREVDHITVPKGSITVNGVSLTVVDSQPGRFSVAIIPYTYDHTNFHRLEVGDEVNLEFDMIGKYVARILEVREAS